MSEEFSGSATWTNLPTLERLKPLIRAIAHEMVRDDIERARKAHGAVGAVDDAGPEVKGSQGTDRRRESDSGISHVTRHVIIMAKTSHSP